MQRFETKGRQDYFDVLGGTERSQAATMTLEPGQSTGGPGNRHEKQDQWLYVVNGSGKAIVEGEKVDFSAGDLVLIEANEAHEIVNTGDEAMLTVNVYAPPAY